MYERNTHFKAINSLACCCRAAQSCESSLSAHFHNFQTPFTSPQAGRNYQTEYHNILMIPEKCKMHPVIAKKMRFTVKQRERERDFIGLPRSFQPSYLSSPASLFICTCSISFNIMFSFHFPTLNSSFPVLYFLSSLLVLSHSISASFSSSDWWNLFLWLSSKAARFGGKPGRINSRRTVDSSKEQKKMREMKRECNCNLFLSRILKSRIC